MARLIEWLFGSGAHDVTGAPVASGLAYFYQEGSTSVAVTVYADHAETTPLVQPVVLDAAGRAEVYCKVQAEIIIKTAAGATVRTTVNGTSVNAEQVDVTWNGSASTLNAALTDIGTRLTTATYTIQSLGGTTPSFEFDTDVQTNVFSVSGTAITSITVTWPSPAPTIAAGTRFRLYVQFVTGATADPTFSWADGDVLVSAEYPTLDELVLTEGLTFPETFSADYEMTTSGYLIQATPWCAVGAALWTL